MTQKDAKKKKAWVVGEDDVGASMLQWDVDPEADSETDDEAGGPLAQTYDFLKRLELPNLKLEDEVDEEGRDPYDSGVYSVKGIQSKP